MDTVYRGLTHTCDDPGCHVIGFIQTLKILDEEGRDEDAPRQDEQAG